MAKLLNIITDPNPILRRKSVEISHEELSSDKIQQLIADMTKTMEERDGVGLAAPQVGENIRLIVVNAKNEMVAMINPKITKKSWARAIEEEGCLSIPLTFGSVERHRKINCVFLDFSGKEKKLYLSGLDARAVQHEIDHLDGILFIDKAKHIHVVNEDQN